MIFFETSGQALVFLMLLRSGLGAGIAYDLIAPLRRRSPRPIAILLDILWCLILFALCFFCLALGGEGKMRLYGLLGMVCGALVYMLGIRTLICGICRMLRVWGKKKEKTI